MHKARYRQRRGRTRPRRPIISAHGIAAILCLAGCAGTPDQTARTGATDASATTPPTKPCHPAELASLKEAERLFHPLNESNADDQLRLTVQHAQGDKSRWRVTREVVAGEEGAANNSKVKSWREQTYVLLPDGSIALEREVNKDDSVIVQFDPPMVVYPSTLSPTAKDTAGFSQSFHVRVHPIDDETKIKVEGPGTQEITYVSDTLGESDHKQVPVFELLSVSVFDFGGPKSRNETTQWLATGVGVVRESRIETTKLLGVQIRENKESWALPSFNIK